MFGKHKLQNIQYMYKYCSAVLSTFACLCCCCVAAPAAVGIVLAVVARVLHSEPALSQRAVTLNRIGFWFALYAFILSCAFWLLSSLFFGQIVKFIIHGAGGASAQLSKLESTLT